MISRTNSGSSTNDDPDDAVDRCVDQAGSPAFMSPECASESPRISVGRVGLGATLYYCLFARGVRRDTPAATMDAIADPHARVPYDDPFYADDARCPPELRAFLARCLERDPERRADARELLGDAWLTRGGESPLTEWSILLRVRCDASDRALAVDHVGGAKDEENEENAENAGASLGDSGSQPRSFVDGAFAAADVSREFAAGEALVTQGTPADAVYLVLEGAAELVLERVVVTDEGEETSSCVFSDGGRRGRRRGGDVRRGTNLRGVRGSDGTTVAIRCERRSSRRRSRRRARRIARG